MSQTITHAEMVAILPKNPTDILAALTPEAVARIHMALGVAGEAGEVVDLVKKTHITGHPWDRTKFVEELGDLEFYLEGLRQALGITRAETLDANVAKLSRRYPGLMYSDAASIARVDKQ